jgi:rubredoxin
MYSVDGELSYQVYVSCPKCKILVDIVEQDDENLLSYALFDNNYNKPKWENLELTFTCTNCNVEFELNNIVY